MVVSAAHAGATTAVPLTYDFFGFPTHYYQVRYRAPGSPALAENVRSLLSDPASPVDDALLGYLANADEEIREE